jgi:uncharacterized membrane protein YoaK (UPF0700 family)
MSTLTSAGHAGQRLSALAVSALVTVAGGAIDAWVYLAHGHVFANAQSGNVVLLGVALADGDIARAATHLPSLLAFVTLDTGPHSEQVTWSFSSRCEDQGRIPNATCRNAL